MRLANYKLAGAKFPHSSVYEKLLKLVNFLQSYCKNKKGDFLIHGVISAEMQPGNLF